MRTMIHDKSGSPDRQEADARTVKIVGALFLAAFLTYGTGYGLVQSVVDAPEYLANVAANEMRLTVGVLLMLANSVVVASIGFLLLPILGRYNRNVAHGYYTARLVEAVVLLVGVVGLLSLVPIGRGYVTADASAAAVHEALGAFALHVNFVAYQVAMAGLGFGSLFFCRLLDRTRLVPRVLAIAGFAGYAVFTLGAVLELFGVSVGLVLSVPGGLFEVAFGIWLIVKGFQHPASASGAPDARAVGAEVAT